ncbi:MAG: carboxyltransferase domain-containing protein [Hyphomicrobiaceae bacterium]|nr:carboxyltransferase domain-containing protein [Hyphomicrobiaceae bacterium]
MIEVELGDEMSFDLNFIAHSYSAAIRDSAIGGFIELVTELASLQVVYDPDLISYDDMISELTAIYSGMGKTDSLELDSRIYYVPALYFDPWTEECVNDYRANVGVKEEDDPDFLVRLNGLEDRADLRRTHSGTDYWVAALGFWPGLCSLMPLDPRCRLVAPKYNPPRMWTPKGTIGLGGAVTCIYPDQTPGGYQIFARTPMPTWDREQRLRAFHDRLALIKAGDRVRFQPIDQDEYDYIDAKVQDGSYEHPYVDYQRFSIANYHSWVKAITADGDREAAGD